MIAGLSEAQSGQRKHMIPPRRGISVFLTVVTVKYGMALSCRLDFVQIVG